MQHRFTRRHWLQMAALGSASLLAACVSAPSGDNTTVDSDVVQAPAVMAPTVLPLPESADDELARMIGQMFMVGFRGMRVDGDHPLVADIVDRHLGGVVLFDYDVPNGEFVRNIESPAQVKALTTDLQDIAATPLLIAADQEGGVVVRLRERYGFPPTVSHAALGALDDVAETAAQAGAMAQVLAEAGINQNLAPVVDVNVNPDNPVIAAYERSFSADPAKVTAHAAAFIEAHHAHGVLCTLKHFPGHGSSRDDSHRGFVDVSATWSPVELEPYAALMDAGLADSVMTAHVFNRAWDETDPATLAPGAIQGLLRDELGYDGVVISDDMQMGAIREFYTFEDSLRKAIDAGLDILAIANNSVYDAMVMQRGVDVVRSLVTDGVIPVARIEESAARIQALKSRLA